MQMQGAGNAQEKVCGQLGLAPTHPFHADRKESYVTLMIREAGFRVGL